MAAGEISPPFYLEMGIVRGKIECEKSCFTRFFKSCFEMGKVFILTSSILFSIFPRRHLMCLLCAIGAYSIQNRNNPTQIGKLLLKSLYFYVIIYHEQFYLQGDMKMSEKIDMPDRWYSPKEICAYLGISRDTMLAWITKKNMPAHKVGRNWMFKTSEIDEWVKSGKSAD